MDGVRFTVAEIEKLVRLTCAVATAAPPDGVPIVLAGLPALVPASSAAVFAADGAGWRVVHAVGAADAAELKKRVVALGAKLDMCAVVKTDRRLSVLAVECRFDGGARLVLALGREAGAEPFTTRDRAVVSLVCPVLASAAASGGRSLAALSAREAEVAQLAARGLGDREIAQKLQIGFATVRTHLQRAFDKLGISNRTEIASLALAREATPAPRRGGRRGDRRRARGR